MSGTIKERLAIIETKLETQTNDIKEDLFYIKNNMTTKATTQMLKWATGVIGTLAVTALITAFKLKGG